MLGIDFTLLLSLSESTVCVDGFDAMVSFSKTMYDKHYLCQ